MITPIQNRYEFVLLFDVENGNPNGDPDAGNMPRIDPETSHGIVTDVAIKRKIRNYVETVKNGAEGFNIYVSEGIALNTQHLKAYTSLDIKSDPKKLPKEKEKAAEITGFMCQNFFDIRTFGAVMTTEVNCGQVRGPVQLAFARSIDPIVQQEITITRVAITNEKDIGKKEHEMGRKHIVPYALYRMEGYISASIAEKTGFSESDLQLFWDALLNMFDHDRAAARGKMSTRGLFVFKHQSKLGDTNAHKLFDLIEIARNETKNPPRAYQDYSIRIHDEKLPATVELIQME